MKSFSSLSRRGSKHEHDNSNEPRPIIVGYAFGPKKMSTMGIIMAEASKAVSTIMTTTSGASAEADSEKKELSSAIGGVEGAKRKPLSKNGQRTVSLTNSDAAADCRDVGVSHQTSEALRQQPRLLTRAALDHHAHGFCEDQLPNDNEDENSSIGSLSAPPSAVSQSLDWEFPLPSHTAGITASTANGTGKIQIRIVGGPVSGGILDIQNFVRFFGSSSSATANSLEDASMTTASTSLAFPPSSTSSSKSPAHISSYVSTRDAASKQPCRQQLIRISFVPIDLESPLEEQHGGNFDVILHKITEDILCLSQLFSSNSLQVKNTCDKIRDHASLRQNLGDTFISETEEQALNRVERLERYKDEHPACCLVDHPSNVRVLMSRSDIAHILTKCLVGVTTTSGIRVGTPRFRVVEIFGDNLADENVVAELIDTAPFTYPLIAKPLTAAGTVASHRMVVVLQREGLQKAISKSPCILQEYANHDGTLYKVYVLGDTVRVFPRPSLPNLPCGLCLSSHKYGQRSFLEFDSQRPYPTLTDFEIPNFNNDVEGDDDSRLFSSFEKSMHRDDSKCPDCQTSMKGTSASLKSSMTVTAEEIRPVAFALRAAFGLELFGFDILVKSQAPFGCCHRRCRNLEMIVVDVNYFPSYKEVANFPSMLAQYLAQRAIEGRMSTAAEFTT